MGYNFKRLSDEEVAQVVANTDKVLMNVGGNICQATIDQIVNTSTLNNSVTTLNDTVATVKNDLIGSGSNYFSDYTNGSATVSSKNTVLYSFKCLKAGYYIFCPHFRFALPLDKIFSVMLSESDTLPYNVNVYPEAITVMGTGATNVVSGMQIYNLKANTKYYVIGYATYGLTIEQVSAYNLYCLKTT